MEEATKMVAVANNDDDDDEDSGQVWLCWVRLGQDRLEKSNGYLGKVRQGYVGFGWVREIEWFLSKATGGLWRKQQKW